jgi:hypothetical protein
MKGSENGSAPVVGSWLHIYNGKEPICCIDTAEPQVGVPNVVVEVAKDVK